MSRKRWLTGIGLGVLGIALTVVAGIAGYGPVRLKWPKTVDPTALEVVGGYARFDASSNLQIFGEVENRGHIDLGVVFVGVTLLDSAGNPVQAGADPKGASSRLEDLARVRFGWGRHVILGHGARRRVPPGERTPFRIVIEQPRVVPFASLRFAAGAIESEPAPAVSVRSLVRQPGGRGNAILGDIVNTGSRRCDDPTVVIALLDSSGTLLETYTALPDLDVLPAGSSDSFEKQDNSAWIDPRINAWVNCR